MALELDSRYPGRFSPGDANYPQGSFKNRSAPGALDGSYLERDWANDKEGFFQRLMLVAGIAPNGSVDTALSSQYYNALLAVIQSNNADTLNTVRINVASASNVNLDSSAGATRHINITGSATITGFTITAGRCYFVRAGGSFTLTNSANLITQTGANIACASGDTFIIRATAANAVEVLCFNRATQLSIGVDQTWQSVSRSFGVTYTNTTGRPIMVNITPAQGASGRGSMLVDGLVVGSYESNATGFSSTLSAIVPSGSTYRYNVTAGSQTISSWVELRS